MSIKIKLVILAVLAVAAIIFGILNAANHSNSSGPSPATTTSNTTSTNPPTFTGESSLTDIGITSEQLTNMEQALQQYLNANNITPSNIGFGSLQKMPLDNTQSTPVWTVQFVVSIDGTAKYRATMKYFNITGVRLYLYDPTSNKLLYDSQNIGDAGGVQ